MPSQLLRHRFSLLETIRGNSCGFFLEHAKEPCPCENAYLLGIGDPWLLQTLPNSALIAE
jgi:hypothetical protein